MRIDGSRRVLIAGKTGSGKSYLARDLLKDMEEANYRIVIVDPKIDWQARVDANGRRYEEPYAKKAPGTVDHPVLIKDFKFNPDNKVSIIHPVEWSEHLGLFLRTILYTRDTIIYFDEGTQLVSANFVPIDFNTVISQGRAKNVGVWYGTQRASRIPVLVKDQASIIIMLRMTNWRDREALADYMNAEAYPEYFEKPLPERYFLVYDDQDDTTTLYAPLNRKKQHARTKAG